MPYEAAPPEKVRKKRCPEHGLIVRKGAKHCPACGEELLVISIFPFKIYFSRTAALSLAFPLFLMGVFMVFDTPGCVSGFNQRRIERHQRQAEVDAAEQLKQDNVKWRLIESFPPYWVDIYKPLKTMRQYTWESDRSFALQEQLEDKPEHSLPRMNGEQVAYFLDLFGDYKTKVYPLLRRLMKEELEQ